jgi:thiamine biosynthesis lipoprotein
MTSRAPVHPSGSASSAAAIALGRPAVPAVAGRTTRALGTFCSVLITRPGALDAAQQILSGELAAIDLACSRFRPDSELSALNRSAGQRVAVSPVFARALDVALLAAEMTDGDVDPTCGRSLVSLGYDKDFAELADDTSALTQPAAPAAGWRCVDFDAEDLTVQVPDGVLLDFGATAKALAADRAVTAIAQDLGDGALVSLGGDIAVAGPAPSAGWAVLVTDDHAAGPDAPGETVAIHTGGMATSSTAVRRWRRGDDAVHHIVDPATSQAADAVWRTVTVVAASCVDANIATTSAMVRGETAIDWLSGLTLAARLVRPDGTVVRIGDWPEPTR